MTIASRQVNCVLHTDQKTSSYGHHQRALLQKSWCNTGTKNAQNSPKKICAKRQQRGDKNADAFLPRIITSDDTLVRQYDPLMERKSPELHHQSSQHKKKNSWYRLLWVKSCLGQQSYLVSGILVNRCHNQFRAANTDNQELETMNVKSLAAQENESSPPAAWQQQTTHQSAHKGSNCNSGVNCSPSSTLWSWFSTLQLLSFFRPLKDVLRGHRFVEGEPNVAWVKSSKASAECCMQTAYGVWHKSG